MSAQDKLENVLRDIHKLISRSEQYSQNRIIVDKQEMFGLIDRLNTSIYEIMEEYELTRQSRDKAEREQKKKGDRIIWDASRKAEDIYAASVMYTDEALTHLQTIMDESTEEIRKVQESMMQDLEEKKKLIRENQLELKSQLQDLIDTEKYLSLIEERNKEIRREKERHNTKFGQYKEKSQFADLKTEIKINKEYFKNAGIELEEDEEELPENAKTAEDAEAVVSEEKKEEDVIDLSTAEWDLDDMSLDSSDDSKKRKLHFFKSK